MIIVNSKLLTRPPVSSDGLNPCITGSVQLLTA